MRVLAARFRDRKSASAALVVIRRRLELADEDAAIAPLGTPGMGDAGDETLLVGRFREGHMEQVRSAVTSEGGVVVADVDERWTRPRLASELPRRAAKQKLTTAQAGGSRVRRIGARQAQSIA